MWTCNSEPLDGGRVRQYVPLRSGLPIRHHDALRYWREDEGFREFFISLLAAVPFAGFRWETPAVSESNADRTFEFVLLDAPELDRTPDVRAFGEQFGAAGKGERVVTFANLGKDAVLVVPCPEGPAGAYVHLAAFVRTAPREQVHELWRKVGEAMEGGLGKKPVWLSTAGMGVSWLHVRMDSRPKYYGFGPYRQLDEGSSS